MNVVNLELCEYMYPVSDGIRVLNRNAERIANWVMRHSGWGSGFSIACRGTSGVLIAAAVVHHLHVANYGFAVKILLIRKDHERSHSCDNIWNHSEGTPILVVDDIVASGQTLYHIGKGLTQFIADASAICIPQYPSLFGVHKDLAHLYPNVKTLLV